MDAFDAAAAAAAVSAAERPRGKVLCSLTGEGTGLPPGEMLLSTRLVLVAGEDVALFPALPKPPLPSPR